MSLRTVRDRIVGDRPEAGVVLVFTAVAMTGLLVVMALVIDLGSTRNVRSNARSAADAGSTGGALALASATTTRSACEDSFSYTYTDLGGPQPSASAITTACLPLAGACLVGGVARTATLSVGATVVTVTNPVPDGSDLMRATALGSRPGQTVDADNDGVACERVAVEITRPQSRFFGGIVSDADRTFTVHSVARFSPFLRPGQIPPALVTLNQTACRAIDAGTNGRIVLLANATGPGVAYSDSDGPGCTSSNPILNSGSSARLIAESSGTTPGQLSWFSAPPSRGWRDCGGCSVATGTETSSANYVGTLWTRSTRTTRTPMDQLYRCTIAPVTLTEPACAPTQDPVTTALGYAAAILIPPLGFTPWTGPCTTTGGNVVMGAAGANIWVNCPVFTVKDNELRIPGGGTIIFTGRVSVEAGGRLAVNVADPPTLDPSGYPIPASSSRQTVLVVGSTDADAINDQSTSARIDMAQTTIVSRGGATIQGSPAIHWTAPTDGPTEGLLYWSESTNPFHIQGGPTIDARGMLFQGNGALTGAGGGVITLDHVQVWADTVSLTGSTTLRMSSDPTTSIGIPSGGSALIR